MTYDVFGGTLNLDQSQLHVSSIHIIWNSVLVIVMRTIRIII